MSHTTPPRNTDRDTVHELTVTGDAQSQEVRAEQLRLLMNGIKTTLFGVISNAIILLVLLWPITQPVWLLLWSLCITLAMTYRVLLFANYRHHPPADIASIGRFEQAFMVGVLLSGAVWSSAVFLLFPVDDTILQLFMAVVIMAVNTGATTNLSYKREPIGVFLLVCLLPVIIRYFMVQTPTSTAIGGLLTVYLVHLHFTSKGIFRNTLQTILLRQEGKIRESFLSKTLQKQDLHARKTPLGMIEWDVNFCVYDWNPAAEAIFGYTREEATGKPAKELIVPEIVRGQVDRVWQELLKQKGGFNNTNENITKDGRTIICEWYNTPLIEEDGTVVGVASMVQDITQRLQTEEALFQEKERAQITLHSIADAVMTTDAAGNIDYMNEKAERLTGWSNNDAHGKPSSEIFRIVDENTGENSDNPVEVCLREATTFELFKHINLINRDSREIPIEQSAAPITDRHGRVIGVVLVFRDVSHERNLRQQLSYQASHDNLTGLTNRREFERQLVEALHNTHVRDNEHALLYMDLDQFKIVNDTCGHIAGDELLRQLAMVLKSQMRSTDTLARLGGDEFGVLLHNCSLLMAEQVANNLRKTIKDFRFVWQEKVFEIGVSIGAVSINSASEDSASLMSAADIACYTAKEKGRNRVHLYQESDDEMAQRHGEMKYVSRIKQALENNRLTLHAQIIKPMALSGKDNVHFEILVRMLADDNSLVPPGQFLSAAERYNLMPAIDRWIINNLFQQYHDLSYHDKPCHFAINLSGTSLNDEDFSAFIHQQFEQYRIPSENITFEITETAAIANLTKAVEFITDLKSYGCKFALDDFGSGLSSFAYLKNLPVDFLKIDGSFIKDIVDDPTDWAMVEAITKIGHVMGLQTIAEFVETEAIKIELVKIGVDYAQGYGIGKPKELRELLNARAGNHRLAQVKN